MPPITSHVFRLDYGIASYRRRDGSAAGPAVDPGMCWYMTSCNRPASEHVSAEEYRKRRHADA